MRQGNPERKEVWRLYKLKEQNSVRGGVLRISLEKSSSRGGTLKKTATVCEPGQSVMGRRNSGKA